MLENTCTNKKLTVYWYWPSKPNLGWSNDCPIIYGICWQQSMQQIKQLLFQKNFGRRSDKTLNIFKYLAVQSAHTSPIKNALNQIYKTWNRIFIGYINTTKHLRVWALKSSKVFITSKLIINMEKQSVDVMLWLSDLASCRACQYQNFQDCGHVTHYG